MSADRIWPVVIIASSLMALTLNLLGSSSSLRLPLVLWFLLVCPGMSLVRMLGERDVLVELTLAVALSVAIDVVVAMVMLYAKLWYPVWGLVVLVCLSVLGASLQVLAPRESRESLSGV